MDVKLPPYGRKLYQFLQTGQIPRDVYIFMGNNCWEATDTHNYNKYAMCLPDHTNPFQYDWPVNQCEILIFDRDRSSQEFVELFAACLFTYGANIVRYVSSDYKLTVFKKEFLNERQNVYPIGDSKR